MNALDMCCGFAGPDPQLQRVNAVGGLDWFIRGNIVEVALFALLFSLIYSTFSVDIEG